MKMLPWMASRIVGLSLGLIVGLGITAIVQLVLGSGTFQNGSYRPETGIIVGLGVFGREMVQRFEPLFKRFFGK